MPREHHNIIVTAFSTGWGIEHLLIICKLFVNFAESQMLANINKSGL